MTVSEAEVADWLAEGVLAEIVAQTFGVMFQFDVVEVANDDPVRVGTSSLVHITGEDLSRIVVLTFEPSLGERMAAELFDMAPDELDDELRADALGELANVVGGAVKALLPTLGHLSLPTVNLSGRPMILGAAQVDSVTFSDGAGRVSAAVWEQKNAHPIRFEVVGGLA